MRNILRKRLYGSSHVPCQINTRDREEDGSHGGIKVPISTGRPWRSSSGYARVETVTCGKYQRHPFGGGADMDIKWLSEKLNLWFFVVRTLWILFMMILKETCMN